MYRNFALSICLFAVVFSCGREARNAVEIFSYRYDPQSSVSLQKERIYYGMLLQPIVKDGKLSLPSLEKEDRENLPDIYVSYVSDYVSLINTYWYLATVLFFRLERCRLSRWEYRKRIIDPCFKR